MRKQVFLITGIAVLLVLAAIGWVVLFSQKPYILAKARLRYNQAVSKKTDLSSGACLGKIADDWVLDIAHLPREPIDNLAQNQCNDFRNGTVHHFVEMSPRGEIITVQ